MLCFKIFFKIFYAKSHSLNILCTFQILTSSVSRSCYCIAVILLIFHQKVEDTRIHYLEHTQKTATCYWSKQNGEVNVLVSFWLKDTGSDKETLIRHWKKTVEEWKTLSFSSMEALLYRLKAQLSCELTLFFGV